MNLSELRDYVRLKVRDFAVPPFFKDAEIDDNLNEAQREACIRAHLIETVVELDINTTDITYPLDPSIIDVVSIADFYDAWTLTETSLVLDRAPNADKTLLMTCYMLPSEMSEDDDSPEIRDVYHRTMAEWAISLCYLVPDSDSFDQQASDRYAARFANTFGERPNAMTQRNRRSKTGRVIQNNGYI